MNRNAFPTHEEDPLAGDVDKFVHPDETRTDEQIVHDEKYAVEPYGDDAADDYWAEYDALYGDKEPEPKAEDKYDFTEKDLEDRKGATTWLTDVAAHYEGLADDYRHRDNDGKVLEHIDSTWSNTKGWLHGEDGKDAKALSRVLQNGYYATSDDNVYSALRTIETGDLRRAGWFSSWPDGSYKASMDIENTELDLDGIRKFTDKFAGLQRQREEAIAKGHTDPLSSQMAEVFGLAGAEAAS